MSNYSDIRIVMEVDGPTVFLQRVIILSFIFITL